MTDAPHTEKVCTCPSGDGSLRWPCPVHPPSSNGGFAERFEKGWYDLIQSPEPMKHTKRYADSLALFKEADAEIERLRAGLESFVQIAKEAATEWDSDNDARVGKLLIAMSGRVPGYREDIDAIHALRQRGAVTR